MVLDAVEMVQMQRHFELVKFLLRNSNELVVLEKLLKFQLVIFMLIFAVLIVHGFLNEFFNALIYGGTDHYVLILDCIAATNAYDFIKVFFIADFKNLIGFFKDQTV